MHGVASFGGDQFAARTDRVWVAGDALTGPATVVDAMAQGKQAALGVIAAAARARATE
jgi:NADPH-dependent glutamate synthase beta subunit-like oxidoreductase